MNYEKLIETVSEIIDNPKINKDGLVLTYELPSIIHAKMNEDLFRRSNPIGIFNPADTFEVEVEGILVKFTKKPE